MSTAAALRIEQPAADTAALIGRVDADGVYLVLVRWDPAQPGDAGIPDQPALVAGRDVVVVLTV